jgi:hypothetical protein
MNNIINARLNNLLQRKKAVAVIATAQIVMPIEMPLRSSSASNQSVHRTMSISMIASLIKGLQSDVRKVAQSIIESQKFDTLPQLVSREEIDRKVLDNNELLLFVGLRDLPKKKYHPEIDASTRAKNFKTGLDYLVNGILGPAIYAVQAVRDPKAKDNDEAAIMYAYNQALEYSKTDKKKGVVLRMTLKADARTISYQEFLRQLILNNTQITGDMKNNIGFQPYLNIFLNTPSLVAIAQGYDAITNIPDGTVVILNRGALRVQKTNATTKNSMYAQVMIEVEAELAKEREKKEAADKKKKEQEKRQREQEKKLAEKKLLNSENETLPQVEKSFGRKILRASSYANDLFAFDNNLIEQIISRQDLNQSEKNEILEFVVAYNSTDIENKEMLSYQLKAMLS